MNIVRQDFENSDNYGNIC